MNLFSDIMPGPGMEHFVELLRLQHVRIELIQSNASPSGPYLQDEDEWVCLLNGNAVLDVEGQMIHLEKGEHYFIPRKTLHHVRMTSPDCVWLAVFAV
ncbi:MAG: cupin domain-containing protein [Eubacteriales bacterium]|nr:cupin domain-containing protein [Eubacteriales bacterium]